MERLTLTDLVLRGGYILRIITLEPIFILHADSLDIARSDHACKALFKLLALRVTRFRPTLGIAQLPIVIMEVGIQRTTHLLQMVAKRTAQRTVTASGICQSLVVLGNAIHLFIVYPHFAAGKPLQFFS